MTNTNSLPALAAFRSPARTLLLLGVLGAGIRLLVLWLALTYHATSLGPYLQRSDAPSYVAVAKTLETGARQADPWNERVFIGWPLLIAAVLPWPASEWTAVLLGITLASCLPIVYYLLARDIQLATVIAFFPPTWLMHSSLGMSEPAYLLLILIAIWLAQRNELTLSGLAMGLATMVRPTALFAAVGVALYLGKRSGWARTVRWAAVWMLGPVLIVVLNLVLYGDPNYQSDLYSNPENFSPVVREALLELQPARVQFNWPFVSLLATPIIADTPWWKIAFIYFHVLAVMAASYVLWRRRWRDDLTHIFAIWAMLTTAFAVSAGPYWGFHSFDRYVLWGLPAYVTAAAAVPARLLRPGPLVGLACASTLAVAWRLLR